MSEEKMIQEDIGNIKISEDVVAVLADKAVKEVEGIAGLSGSLAESFAVVLGKKTGVRGIGVDIKEDTATVNLHTIVKYGFRIPEVAWQAQEVVKSTIESMTGLSVAKVNISVEGVEFPEDSKPEPVEEDRKEDIVVDQENVIEVEEES